MKIYTVLITIICLGQFLMVSQGDQIPDSRDVLAAQEVDTLPPSFSWRDINGVDYTTPVRDQSPFPSCETFALNAAIETMVQYQVGYPFGCDLSEAHLYFFSGGNVDWGSLPENDTDFLVSYGIPDEACWPYPTILQSYPLNTTADDWMDRTVKINDWYYLPEDITAIKSAIMTNGPVPTYFQVFDDFLKYKQGVYRHRWGDYRGIHYVCIVGWNDNPGYWIIKNSWGTEYQDEGWFNIAYGECSIEKKSFYLDGVSGQFPIVYVDDDNTEGPWDGSVMHPYQTIQQGINHAYEGWTINVKSGVYQEHLKVNKTVNIDGENKDTTIIDGDGIGHVVTIEKPHVRISGFTIQNSGQQPFEAGVKTLSLYSNATIKNNIFRDNGIGVFLNYAYTQDYGKYSWNIVEDNLFVDNIDGLYIHWSDCNEVRRNIFEDNGRYGIEVESSRYSMFEDNVIQRNGECGLLLQAASHENTISDNDFIDHTVHAYFDGSLKNKWSGNYWSDSPWIILKPIRGQLDIYDIPWIDFDFFPAMHPNTT